jgi:hypothetical protein
VNKSDATKLLVSEGWTKADAIRALSDINFQTDPDELTIRRGISQFAGQELINRQRLQAAQKGIVTKRSKELSLTVDENKELQNKTNFLNSKNNELTQVNEELQKDNKALKNIVDQIRLKLALDMKQLVRFEDSEIRKELIKWYTKIQG